jgi:mannitol 2-dehydrogenase
VTALSSAALPSVSSATEVPSYQRDDVSVGIVHIGVGGFHRAHQAVYLDSLLAVEEAARSFGLCGVSLLPQDRKIVEVMNAQDMLYTVLVKHPNGTQQARIVGSIIGHLFAPDDPERVLTLMADPKVRIVSLTITEGGYFHDTARGTVDLDAPDLIHDAQHRQTPRTAFGYIIEGLRRRRDQGTPPFTVMSCDNLHANGDVASHVVIALATRIDPALAHWIATEVAFPNSMVDRITPRTTDDDVDAVRMITGLDDAWPVTCEPFSQWVIEDHFSGDRPAWEVVGAQLVEDVTPYELMKMRQLNAGHQTVAYPGRLLGLHYAHEAANDPTIRRLLQRYLAESAESLPPLPGIDVAEYGTSIVERFSNPQIEDSLARLSAQTSTMMATYVLPVVRDLLNAGRPAPISIAVVACWAHFLGGVADDGTPLEIVDHQIAGLQRRAGSQSNDPLAVIRDNPLFHGLEGRDDFEGPFAAILEQIQANGTREALEAILA